VPRCLPAPRCRGSVWRCTRLCRLRKRGALPLPRGNGPQTAARLFRSRGETRLRCSTWQGLSGGEASLFAGQRNGESVQGLQVTRGSGSSPGPSQGSASLSPAASALGIARISRRALCTQAGGGGRWCRHAALPQFPSLLASRRQRQAGKRSRPGAWR